jgi:hypothetical protein
LPTPLDGTYTLERWNAERIGHLKASAKLFLEEREG